jgi:hypothetical protein
MEHQAPLWIKYAIFRCKTPKGFSRVSSMKTGIFTKMSRDALHQSALLWHNSVRKQDTFKKIREWFQPGLYMKALGSLAKVPKRRQ